MLLICQSNTLQWSRIKMVSYLNNYLHKRKRYSFLLELYQRFVIGPMSFFVWWSVIHFEQTSRIIWGNVLRDLCNVPTAHRDREYIDLSLIVTLSYVAPSLSLSPSLSLLNGRSMLTSIEITERSYVTCKVRAARRRTFRNSMDHHSIENYHYERSYDKSKRNKLLSQKLREID